MTHEPPWLNFLLNPSAYPHEAGEVTCIQTHISWVFIAGQLVYKVKKPVDFGFLDFTTLEKRRLFCHEEIRLNRRLCPDIYLECRPLTEENGNFSLKGTGKPVEWLTVMKRMPEDGMMSRMMEEDLLGHHEMDLIVERLVPFYQKEAAVGDAVKKYGTLDVISQNTEENYDQTVSFIGSIMPIDTFHKIREYTRNFIRDKKTLFESRISKGWIKEGHGDLYSANICFDALKDTVYIFDCIEFNERFRCGDVASDVTFLAMDLDFHGFPVLSSYFLETFSQGMADGDLLELAAFYKCYRAYVRGKINCFTSVSEGIEQPLRDAAQKNAADYFRLALRYAEGCAESPDFFVFYGLSGTGKTTLATEWSRRSGVPCYNSDIARKELVAGIPSGERRHEPFEHGIYSPEMTRRTYRALSRLAGRHLVRGESVSVDATFREEQDRKMMMELASQTNAKIHFVLCECPEDVIRNRLEKRVQAGFGASDGRWEIYLRQKDKFSPRAGLDHIPVTVLDTSRPMDELIEIVDALKKA